MMPVTLATLSESATICIIARCVKQPARCAVAGHAVALEVADMGPQSPRRSHSAHHAGLDHGGSGAAVEEPGGGKAGRATASELAGTAAAAP
ncbi:hypothetical protein AB0176_26315, partial [Klebsiella pneumoniae]